MERRSNRSRRTAAVLLWTWVVVHLSPGAFAAQAEAARAIADQVRAYARSEDPAERKAALVSLAQIGKGCTEDAPRKAAAAGLAKGLSDDEPSVRATAIQLLMDGQDREVALDALLASSRDFARELAAVSAEIEKLRPALELKPKRPEGSDLDQLQRSMKLLTESMEPRVRLGVLTGLCPHYILAFASLEDDRSVDGLGALASVIGVSDELHRALARYGTAKCLRYAADGLAKTGANREEIVERCAKVRAYRIGKKPSWFEGDALVWLGQEERRIAELLAPLEKELAVYDERAAEILGVWRSFAQERGLPPPPESAWEARAWSAWAEAGAPLLPASVGAR